MIQIVQTAENIDFTASDIIKNGTIAEATELVRSRLLDETNPEWLVRGMVAIWKRQTTDEQQSQQTKHANARGFNGTDAAILTSFVSQWMTKDWLSPKQLFLARKKMVKYARQLVLAARGQ